MTPKQPSRKKTRTKVRKTTRRPAPKAKRVARAVVGKTPAKTRSTRKKTSAVTGKPSVVRRRASKRRVVAKKTARRPRSPAAGSAPKTRVSTQLFLVARDPRWLYAYWQFSSKDRPSRNKISTTGPLTLRVYQDSPAGALVREVKLNEGASHCFVPVTKGDTRFAAELGYQPPQGLWRSVACSSPATTPPDTVATDSTVVLATFPVHVPFWQIMETLGAALVGKQPLLEAVQLLHAAGYTGLPGGVSAGAPAEHWTPAQARALDKLIGAESVRRQLHRELASLAAAQIIPPESPESPASPTSPAGGWTVD